MMSWCFDCSGGSKAGRRSEKGEGMQGGTISLRVPVQLHTQLKEAAWKRRVSLNRLCVDCLELYLRAAGNCPTESHVSKEPSCERSSQGGGF